MALRVTGQSITTTLTIQFTDNASVTTNYNADATPVAKVYLSSVLVETISGSSITNVLTGIYTVDWTPAEAGQYKVLWSFAVSAVSYTQDEDIFVLAAASTSVTPTGDADIGNENVCTITGTFIQSNGNYHEGVIVTFDPVTTRARNTSFGYITKHSTVSSNSYGYISMPLLRGTEGLLSVSFAGIVRTVTIPDSVTVDIFDLLASYADDIDIKTPVLDTIPRSSL